MKKEKIEVIVEIKTKMSLLTAIKLRVIGNALPKIESLIKELVKSNYKREN